MRVDLGRRWLPTVCAIALLSVTANSVAEPIDPGFDLFKTKSGQITLKNLKGNPINPLTIPLVGNPLKSNPLKGNPLTSNILPPWSGGNTDTVIQRLGKLPAPNGGPGTGTIDTEIVALSLVSKDPVDLGKKGKFQAFVTLSRTSPGETIVQSHEDKTKGGTFDSIFDIFFQIDLIPIGGNNADPIRELVNALGSAVGSSYSHEPPPFYPTIPNFPAGNFFPETLGITNGVFSLLLAPAQAAPEPLTFALFGTGLLLVGLGRRRQRQNN